jgi:hypothetical protein
MIVSLARIAVQAFGALIAIGCVWGMIAPRGLIGVVRKVASRRMGLGFAVAVRVLLGAALLTAAQVSSFPRAFTVLGWIAILAAIVLLIVGRTGMSRIVDWVSRWSPASIRAWLLLGLLFAALLVFGA